MLFMLAQNKFRRNRMKPMYPRKDRRRHDHVVFIERRKGKIWMYGEILLFVGLILYIFWRLI